MGRAADDPRHPYNVRRRKWVERACLPDRDYSWDKVPSAARTPCQLWVRGAARGDRGPGLLLYGPPGRGKTAAAALTLRDSLMAGNDKAFGETWEQVPYRPGYYISYSDFMRTYKKSWDTGQEEASELIDDLFFSSSHTWHRAKILVLDDVGKEQAGASGFNRHVLHDLFRSRWDKGALTIVTTNTSPENFGELYGDAMASFIWEGFVFVSFEDEPDQRH